jgi:hypothetical protein
MMHLKVCFQEANEDDGLCVLWVASRTRKLMRLMVFDVFRPSRSICEATNT